MAMPTTRQASNHKTTTSKTATRKATTKRATAKRDPFQQRQRIIEYLETLKTPLSTDELDEILAVAEKEKFSALSLLERFLSILASLRVDLAKQRQAHLAIGERHFRFVRVVIFVFHKTNPA